MVQKCRLECYSHFVDCSKFSLSNVNIEHVEDFTMGLINAWINPISFFCNHHSLATDVNSCPKILSDAFGEELPFLSSVMSGYFSLWNVTWNQFLFHEPRDKHYLAKRVNSSIDPCSGGIIREGDKVSLVGSMIWAILPQTLPFNHILACGTWITNANIWSWLLGTIFGTLNLFANNIDVCCIDKRCLFNDAAVLPK